MMSKEIKGLGSSSRAIVW